MRFQLVARTGHPDFLDLPWDVPLEDWDVPRLVDVPRGIHRHVVRTVAYGDDIYVVKELPRRYAQREYRFLRFLAEEAVPVVDVVGVVTQRSTGDDEPIDAALITKHLEFSLPYRLLFQREDASRLKEPMLDALVDLLVRIHLVGFRWGDCSLSNTLFRRDAGRLSAYLVDAETGELHDRLTDGQRWSDVDGAVERCAGELLDLQAAGVVRADLDPAELGDALRQRYDDLWAELTREEVFGPDERYRITDRLRRINELGFDVEEVELEGQGDRLTLKLSTKVVEPGRHRRRLRELTGLDVQDHQAARLLNDMESFRAAVESQEERTYPTHVIAARWLQESFEPTVAEIPPELRGKRDPAQLFHEVLEHWYFMSTIEGRDMGLLSAARSYAANVLPHVPDERTVGDDVEG
ncbi:MAG: DUF4032 domain-containing protein [Actinobacteria bacterium]|nr:DUF4032 domain-containing protein [Actinomycetota bacterium]